MTTTETTYAVGAFFDSIFGSDHGYVCLATTKPPARRDTFVEKYFEWPDERGDMLNYIDKMAPTHNVYFCVNILSLKKRVKANAIPQNLVWADLDTCRPDRIETPPQVVIESSPGRYQAIWKLDQRIDPPIAENYSKRIAYQYESFGVDKSGHDLTQLLRVPGTYNFKYDLMDTPPNISLLTNLDVLLPVEVFEALPQADDMPIEDVVGMPEIDLLPSVDQILYAYQDKLKQTAFARYYSEEPSSDWSKSLWRLINTCLEVGMSREEVFAVTRGAKCNKYERDGRPVSHLWREIVKAELQHKQLQVILGEHKILNMPVLLSEAEAESLPETIIDTYKEWAVSATDAVEEYHELSSVVLLSALMSKTLRLHSNLPFNLIPNIWGMILGDSTLTRKTTAMDMAMSFIDDIDRDLIIATDASAEGVVTALELRPKMVSVFYRDEIAGLFEAFHKKDYLAAMPEILTKLYDVPTFFTRQLAKKTITVIEPVFIFFGGGIQDKTYSLISEEYFLSGFMPRFLIVTGRADIDRVRPTGPPTVVDGTKREQLLNHFSALYNHYSLDEAQINVGGQMMSIGKEVQVTLTDAAWTRFADMEAKLIQAAYDSPHATRAMPSFQRMAFSMLKIAMLLSASKDLQDKVVVDVPDLLCASFYIQKWGRHFVDMIKQSGQNKDETLMAQVYRTIESHPGINRGQIMSRHRLSARQMSDVETTLEQRYMIQVEKRGKGIVYWPIGR